MAKAKKFQILHADGTVIEFPINDLKKPIDGVRAAFGATGYVDIYFEDGLIKISSSGVEPYISTDSEGAFVLSAR